MCVKITNRPTDGKLGIYTHFYMMLYDCLDLMNDSKKGDQTFRKHPVYNEAHLRVDSRFV